MQSFLIDENFRRAIIRGLLRQLPEVDVVRVQDVGLPRADDESILAWAAEHRRILLTHDRETMPAFAIAQVRRGHAMPGVVVSNETLPYRTAIENLVLMIGASREDEWEN